MWDYALITSRSVSQQILGILFHSCYYSGAITTFNLGTPGHTQYYYKCLTQWMLVLHIYYRQDWWVCFFFIVFLSGYCQVDVRSTFRWPNPWKHTIMYIQMLGLSILMYVNMKNNAITYMCHSNAHWKSTEMVNFDGNNGILLQSFHGQKFIIWPMCIFIDKLCNMKRY